MVKHVSKEQIEKARSVGVLEYLDRHEPHNLVRSAPNEWKLKDHDSLKISNGKFNWFSRGIGGSNALDYLVKVRGVDFKAAVVELSGGEVGIVHEIGKRSFSIAPKKESSGTQKSVPFFELPKANSHNNDAIKYLKERGIDERIIDACIREKILYQSVEYKKPLFKIVNGEKMPIYQDVYGKNAHRYEAIKGGCVFVGHDRNNNPKFACERDTNTDYKKDVHGSNKVYNFCIPPKDKETQNLYVFEAPIDALSHASIAKIANLDWDGYRLSLGGVSQIALDAFLENNPSIKNIHLCLDNDTAGKQATERISAALMLSDKYKDANVHIAFPPVGKDYNETLLRVVENQKRQQERLSQARQPPIPEQAQQKTQIAAATLQAQRKQETQKHKKRYEQSL